MNPSDKSLPDHSDRIIENTQKDKKIHSMSLQHKDHNGVRLSPWRHIWQQRYTGDSSITTCERSTNQDDQKA